MGAKNILAAGEFEINSNLTSLLREGVYKIRPLFGRLKLYPSGTSGFRQGLVLSPGKWKPSCCSQSCFGTLGDSHAASTQETVLFLPQLFLSFHPGTRDSASIEKQTLECCRVNRRIGKQLKITPILMIRPIGGRKAGHGRQAMLI